MMLHLFRAFADLCFPPDSMVTTQAPANPWVGLFDMLAPPRSRIAATPPQRTAPPVVIGKDGDEVVALDFAHRPKSMYVIGGTGTGKSTLIENLILHDMNHGIGCAVIDPYGPLVDGVLDRLPKKAQDSVILLDPRDYDWPFGINILECEDPGNPIEVEKTQDRCLHLFEQLWE
jgi:hypothetical protein